MLDHDPPQKSGEENQARPSHLGQALQLGAVYELKHQRLPNRRTERVRGQGSTLLENHPSLPVHPRLLPRRGRVVPQSRRRHVRGGGEPALSPEQIRPRKAHLPGTQVQGVCETGLYEWRSRLCPKQRGSQEVLLHLLFSLKAFRIFLRSRLYKLCCFSSSWSTPQVHPRFQLRTVHALHRRGGHGLGDVHGDHEG